MIVSYLNSFILIFISDYSFLENTGKKKVKDFNENFKKNACIEMCI